MNEQTVMVTVQPQVSTYSVRIGAGMLAHVSNALNGNQPTRSATIITDSNVGPLYADRVVAALSGRGCAARVVTIPAGDQSKSLEQTGRIYDALADARHERDESIIALGGGMIGDLAGFVAATWMRGVPLVQCPTSLEAAIDAAIGGKTAINHARGKNLIGAFHQPAAVFIDTDCLTTLPERDYRAALAESVKHAIISGVEFLNWHEDHIAAITARDSVTLVELIRRNCTIKAGIVTADPHERSAGDVGRAALNFGHTVGHALERGLGFELRHGEAVSLGMAAEMELAHRHAGFPVDDRRRCENLLRSLGLLTQLPATAPADLLDLMQSDKKAHGGRPRFVVPARIGSMVWCNAMEQADLDAMLARLRPGTLPTN